MEENNNLIDLDDKRSIIEFLQAPASKIAEVLTGILSSDSSGIKLSVGRLIQASIKFKLLSQLGKELRDYAKKGKIKEDILGTASGQSALYEILKFIDGDTPDEERFRAMKSVFLFSISTDTIEIEKELAYELMKVCKKISSGAILVLKASYDIVNGEVSFNYDGTIDLGIHSVADWFNIVAKQIGHNISSLVELYEDELVNPKLISPRTLSDSSGIRKTKYFRLTELGVKLSDFISKYP